MNSIMQHYFPAVEAKLKTAFLSPVGGIAQIREPIFMW